MRYKAMQRSPIGLWLLSIAGPLAGVTVLHRALRQVRPTVADDVAFMVLTLGVIGSFPTALFRLRGFQDRHHLELVRFHDRERRLRAQIEILHQAAEASTSAQSPEQILQRLVELARDLIGARYAALGVLSFQGAIDAFYTAGITDEEREHIGAPPQGRGLLGVIPTAGVALNIPNIAQDTRRVGFPAGHPPMTSLMGVAVVLAGRVLGNLYVSDRTIETINQTEFSSEDERMLSMLAAHAALVIEQARLGTQVRTLDLVAGREHNRTDLHDSAIQAIYGVNLELEIAVEEMGLDPAAAQQRIDLAIDHLGEVIKKIRSYILGLDPATGTLSLPEALTALLAETRAHTLLETDLRVEGTEARSLPPYLVQDLLQMAREAVSNVVLHAHAGRLWATLQATALDVHLQVSDNGDGFDSRLVVPPHRTGLRYLQERARGLGGTLMVQSAPGAGTAIDVRVPLSAAAEGQSHV